MKRYIIYIGLLINIIIGCTEEDLIKQGTVGDKEVWVTLNFGHQSFEKINIETRATLGEIAESRVENLFAYVFDANGKRLYSHYYDNSSREEKLPATAGNYWTVANRTSSNNNDTQGKIMIKSPTMTGGSIYLIANLNADQLNISPEQLNTIGTLSELQALTITMNQEITSRTGCFLMTGSVSGINVAEDGSITTSSGGMVDIPLVRLDAKVTVNVQVGESSDEGQEMKDFVPESWQIMRLPKGTKVLADSDDDADELGYFDSPEQYFETDADGLKSFSFYMLENMEDLPNSVKMLTYNERDLRNKKSDGSYDNSNGLWKYASEDATYMVIKGRVQMEVDTEEETGMQYLEADVTYYVHLGNFGNSKGGGSYNDFTINRNTHYTYDITINGVNNIELEVTTDKENQSGATGQVYKSREEIYTFDAHYGQRVFRIDAESVLDKTVTWYVKTPFSEGSPGMESGTQVPNLDYRWVWFMVNEEEYNGVYSEKNRIYPGDQYQTVDSLENDELMNVVEFTNFIKEEKIKFKNAAEDEKATASAFKRDNDNVYCLYVTAFVDEYYYETNPLNDTDSSEKLWKKFVNQPNRLMHILCDSELSKDGESSVTNSVITIRQRSIQTPYNLEKAETAWGCESVDEFADSQLFFYNTDENMSTETSRNLGNNIGVSSTVNGFYNSVKIWGITPGKTRWDAYLDYERVNDYSAKINNSTLTTYFLKNQYAALRYATLLRNRDNNGNGVIDADELRWYVASLNQLYDLYMGQLGLNSDAALYTPQIAARPNYTGPYRGASGWRNHVISSTWEGNQPTVLWAEEGISRSPYATRHGKPAPYSIRCVRNLGLGTPNVTEEGTEGVDYPTSLIKVTEPTGTHGYLFDLSNINTKSLRYYTSRELEPGNENEETARVYYGFETGDIVTYPSENQGGANNTGNYAALKEALEAGTNIGCDTENGFRVPNVREGALMSLYCSSTWWGSGSIMTGTWYSNGGLGNGNDGNYTSWQFSHRYATIGGSNVRSIRTVRDWYPTPTE